MDKRMLAMKAAYLADYEGALTRGSYGEEITFKNTMLVQWSSQQSAWVQALAWAEVDCIGVWDSTFGVIPNLTYNKYSEIVKAALAVYHKEPGSMGRFKKVVRDVTKA